MAKELTLQRHYAFRPESHTQPHQHRKCPCISWYLVNQVEWWHLVNNSRTIYLTVGEMWNKIAALWLSSTLNWRQSLGHIYIRDCHARGYISDMHKIKCSNFSLKGIFSFANVPLRFSNYFHIRWQSPKPNCSDTCQIWTGYIIGNQSANYDLLGEYFEKYGSGSVIMQYIFSMLLTNLGYLLFV